MKAPWPFFNPPEPGAPAFANLPTKEGRQLGRHLARWAEQAERKLPLEGIEIPSRCHDCAFRRGTPPNQSGATLSNALKCVIESDPFFCHLGDQESICRGYLLLVADKTPGTPRPPILLGPIE